MTLYLTRKATYYLLQPDGTTPDPLPRDRSRRLRVDPETLRFIYPEGRWNNGQMDALYTSLEPDTAIAEAVHRAQRPPTRERSKFIASARAAFLGLAAAPSVRFVLLSFDDLQVEPDREWDARSLGDVEVDFSPLLVPWDWELPQTIGLSHWVAGRFLLVVPSCPPWNRTPRSVEWNAVNYVGDGHYPADALPGWSNVRYELELDVPAVGA